MEKQKARIFRLARFEDFDDDKIEAELQDVRNREEALERERVTIEALREELGSMDDAREKVESWRRHYNGERPHSALGYLAPEEFAARSSQNQRAG